MERDQLSESLRELEAKNLEKQEELRIAHMHLKEHQEIIDQLRGIVSEKTDEISNMQMDLENSNAKLQEKIQELKTNEHQLFKLKEDVSETQKKISEIEKLKKQFKTQSLTLDKMEMENSQLAQKLHENLEEMKSVMKERDSLRVVEENLKLEGDQLKANLQETIVRDLETQQELKIARMHLKEHQETIDKLRERVSENQVKFQKIQELETALHEARKSAKDKKEKIIEMQREQEMTNDAIDKMLLKVDDTNKYLIKAKAIVQNLEENVALTAKLSKEVEYLQQAGESRLREEEKCQEVGEGKLLSRIKRCKEVTEM
ncbi:centromere-associated protein E-like [Diceros bicornis minor]|uniref:centromere-associated protein E-like n=1 Tax=Diceros bicornis minor TaxID=77932 RepID=UPI0026F0E1BE|nr:centromere-associated protein E-like [Diceros bicornis minor]